MKTIPLLRNSCLGLALLVGAGLQFNVSSVQAADTWLTVDQPGFDGYVEALVIDSSPSSAYQGNLYAMGDNDFSALTIRRSTDDGITWDTVDTYPDPGSSAYYFCAAADPAGAVYATGTAAGAWIVRKSTDGGDNWETINTYLYPGQGSGRNFPEGMAIDEGGTIYLAGTVSPASRNGRSSQDRWLVRRSTDGGVNWDNVDDYGHVFWAWALDVAASNGTVYVVGSGYDGAKSWLVRKGVPNASGGLDWQTIDSFRLETGMWAEAVAICADPAGNLHVVGYADSSETIPGTGKGKKNTPQQVTRRNWVVRTLPAGGTWQTSDVYRGISDYRYEARDVSVAADGTVWVNGYGHGPSGSEAKWITRKLPSGGAWTDSSDLSNGAGICLVTVPGGAVFTGGRSNRLWTIRGLVSE